MAAFGVGCGDGRREAVAGNALRLQGTCSVAQYRATFELGATAKCEDEAADLLRRRSTRERDDG